MRKRGAHLIQGQSCCAIASLGTQPQESCVSHEIWFSTAVLHVLKQAQCSLQQPRRQLVVDGRFTGFQGQVVRHRVRLHTWGKCKRRLGGLANYEHSMVGMLCQKVSC